ncbi:MAG: hypothetical protein IPI55_17100 [Flavobacteriales bacterium]|nr:hypothetical protein [Flavobacteriales bacterium]
MRGVLIAVVVSQVMACQRPSAGSDAEDAAVQDAAVQTDAAVTPNAAVLPDAAVMPDAAVVPDATVTPDAAMATDAAVTPDAAMTPDAAVVPDAAVTPDAAVSGMDAGPPNEVTALGHGARVVSHTLPTQMETGEVVTAAITLENTGTMAWRAVQQYRLGSPMDEDPFVAEGRVDLPVTPVEPGATVTFVFTMVAPVTPGTYQADWRMLREHVEWFGETLAVNVVVTAGACANPVPPPLNRMNAVIHNDLGWRKVLDSTPIVYGHDYCQEIGFTDDRLFCPPRPEGHPQVDVCNALVVGQALDTGRGANMELQWSAMCGFSDGRTLRQPWGQPVSGGGVWPRDGAGLRAQQHLPGRGGALTAARRCPARAPAVPALPAARAQTQGWST